MQEAALLEIARVDNVYRYRLGQPRMKAAVRQYATAPISRADQESLQQAMARAAHSADGPFAIQALGRLLYSLLVPPEIQAFLRNLETPLVISTDAPDIPWELFYDDTRAEFLALRLALGRRLVTAAEVVPGASSWLPGSLSVLLIGNPEGDLEGADREVELLQQMVGRARGTVRVLSRSRAALLPVQLCLQDNGQGYAAIHYAGHAAHDRALKQDALLLAERGRLTGDAIRKLLRGHPFVFLNACGTDQPSAPSRRTALPWQVAEGLAAAFVGAGARAVVGTRWEVDDHSSGEFAALFYARALQGVPIGEALRQARVRFGEQSPDDTTWAAFVLYGDPRLTLIDPAAASGANSQVNRGRSSAPGLALDAHAQQVLAIALREAYSAGYQRVETPHLVIGLTKVPDSRTAHGLRAQGFDPRRVRAVLRCALRPAGPPLEKEPPAGAVPLSARVQGILDLAAAQARSDGAPTIGEYHLLCGFVQVQGSATAEYLKRLGVDLNRLTVPEAQAPTPSAASATPLLDMLGRDLTREAAQGRLRPVIGRRYELGRVARALARSEKNAPLLVGDAGVGKTAIVEALAQRIAQGEVPAHLRGKRLIELPVASLVAGTRYRGDLEERLLAVIREARQPEVILFLDEIHTLVGAGRSESGSLDAANILKPALARGEIRCIGATTSSGYRESIEKDPALERRFQIIAVEEPSAEEALEILRRTAPRYEQLHRVRLAEEALEAAVQMSITYLPQRRLPDKAADLVDEACVRARVSSPSHWGEVGLAEAEVPLVDAATIAQVVAEWTGIPVARSTEADYARLLRLEQTLHESVVGQDEAISALARAVRLRQSGLTALTRPAGVFLFLGPTGVGKTQAAKALAKALFGSEAALIRFDMSEFSEPHSVARLIGSPPGYAAHEEGGQLVTALQRRPHAVVLFDEIDKAHPDILGVFLQLFDEGRLTDGRGRVADGRHALFIMTANMGRGQAAHRLGLTPPGEGATEHPAFPADLLRVIRPELRGRIDEVIVFQPLTPEQVRAIAERQVQALAERVQALHGIRLSVDASALELLCREGYSNDLGARPLQRAVERWIASPLSELVLTGVHGRAVASADGGRIKVRLEHSNSSASSDVPESRGKEAP